MDGSTDAGNIEDELIAVMYCQVDEEVQEMRSCIRYLSVKEPEKADARGLIACLCDAMKEIGLDNFLDKASVLGIEDKPIVVGGGTDGACSSKCRGTERNEGHHARGTPMAILDMVLLPPLRTSV